MTETTEPQAEPNQDAKEKTAGPNAAAVPAQSAAIATALALGLTDRDLLYLLGEVTWLMSRSPRHRYVFMSDLEWQVMPPVVLRQARLFRNKPAGARPDQPGTPLAFVTWALVSDAVDQRLQSGIGRLQPAEWRSGPNPWIIDVVAPFGGADKAVEEVVKTVFGGKPVPVVGMVGQEKTPASQPNTDADQ